jgi:hypothetical protein
LNRNFDSTREDFAEEPGPIRRIAGELPGGPPVRGGVARGGVEPPTYRFSGGRSYQLSYLAEPAHAPGDARAGWCKATQTGLEPATFAVTGRRANQLRHWALLWN